MIVERAALALRRVMVRTSRSPLRHLWAGLYGAVARMAALVVAPRGTGTSVYLTGSLASGEPVYGLSDIDLVAIATDESECRRARRRFERLCRALPPLRLLMPDFSTYDAAGLARILGSSYLVNGLDDGAAVFLGPEAIRDQKGLLERPGLCGARDWRRLRGPSRVTQAPERQDPLLAAWLELQYRWQWAPHSSRTEAGAYRLASTLAGEAARIWLWLARGERHEVGGLPLERAVSLMGGESEALLDALHANRSQHRSRTLPAEGLHALFVSISGAIAELVDERAARVGATQVKLLGAEAGDSGEEGVPLLDWRALVLPVLDWSTPNLPRVIEERLVPHDGDPADPAALTVAAGRSKRGRVTALRHGSLLVEPTPDVRGRGRLRAAQCWASDPVSAALLDGRTQAAFPEVPGWSAYDWASRAVAEHRAWLFGGPGRTTSPQDWIGTWPAMASRTPATLGLLLSAARSALFLESVEAGDPELAVMFGDIASAHSRRNAGIGGAAAEAHAAMDECRREGCRVPSNLVKDFRRQVASLPAYAPGVARVARVAT